MTKKERLFRTLSSLMAEHSQQDWDYAIEQIKARATQLDKIPVTNKRPKLKTNKRISGNKKETRRTPSRPNYTAKQPETKELEALFNDRKHKPNHTELKAFAQAIAIKEDLPRTSQETLQVIFQHLDNLAEDSRKKRIRTGLEQIVNIEETDNDRYSRWFDLITKSESS